MNNLELYKLSIDNAEKCHDELYKKEKIIITKVKGETNALIEANRKILNYVTAFKVIEELGKGYDDKMPIVANMIELLKTEGINNSEFTNYRCIHDLSYSLYKNMSYGEQVNFLMYVIPEYIKNRHDMYQSHGYTATTLQVRSDSIAHKRSGQLGTHKVSAMLEHIGITKFDKKDLSLLSTEDNYYVLPDSDGEKSFDFLKEKLKFIFSWSAEKQNKETDFLVKRKGKYYIIEHKHMKEGGGGQHKQMEEVIAFIKQSDEKISYVAFLDGEYFKILGTEKIDGKLAEQNRQIKSFLAQNVNNYFVNTVGFTKLLS